MGVGIDHGNLAEQLIDQIDSLSASDRRQLRTAAGKGKRTNPASKAIVAHMLPPGLSLEEAERYFFAITLCAACRAGKDSKASFGRALGIADRKADTGQFSAILARLLDIEDAQQQATQVAHGIKYLNAARVTLDRVLLLGDILGWRDPDRKVRQTWAREYARASLRPSEKYGDVVLDFFGVLDGFTDEQKEAFEACGLTPLPAAPGNVLIAFYTALPEKVYPLDEEIFYQAAILNAINLEPCAPQKNLGAALRSVCTSENEEHLSITLKKLLESKREQLYPLLFNMIIYLRKLKVGFCPEQLLNDLLFWDHPARTVQTTWWNSFINR